MISMNEDYTRLGVKQTLEINIQTNHMELCGYFLDEENNYYISTVYYGVCLKEPVPDLRRAKGKSDPLMFNINMCRTAFKNKKGNFEVFPHPSILQLMDMYEAYKSTPATSCSVTRGMYSLDGRYLLNMWYMLSNISVYHIGTTKTTNKSVFYVVGNNGDGILMGIMN